jgi:hypothetical protein
MLASDNRGVRADLEYQVDLEWHQADPVSRVVPEQRQADLVSRVALERCQVVPEYQVVPEQFRADLGYQVVLEWGPRVNPLVRCPPYPLVALPLPLPLAALPQPLPLVALPRPLLLVRPTPGNDQPYKPKNPAPDSFGAGFFNVPIVSALLWVSLRFELIFTKSVANSADSFDQLSATARFGQLTPQGLDVDIDRAFQND